MGAGALLNLTTCLLAQIKQVRTREGRIECIRRIEARLERFTGKEYRPLGPKPVPKVTKEGKNAVKDALAYLNKSDIVDYDSLGFSVDVCRPLRFSSEDHATDIGSVGITSHKGSDGSKPHERMKRYCIWRKACGEVIWYGKLPVEGDFAVIAQVIFPKLYRVLSIYPLTPIVHRM